MKAFILMIILFSANFSFACVDLSGNYLISLGEENMKIIVSQKGCSEVHFLDAEGNPIETIFTDGVERKQSPPQPAEPTVEKCILNETLMACKGHEVRSKYFKYSRTYKKLDNGDIESVQTIPDVYDGNKTTFQTITDVFKKR